MRSGSLFNKITNTFSSNLIKDFFYHYFSGHSWKFHRLLNFPGKKFTSKVTLHHVPRNNHFYLVIIIMKWLRWKAFPVKLSASNVIWKKKMELCLKKFSSSQNGRHHVVVDIVVDYPGCHICRLTLRRLFPTNHSKMWSQLPPPIRFRLPVSDLWLFCWPQQPPVMIHHIEWTATKTVAAGATG